MTGMKFFGYRSIAAGVVLSSILALACPGSASTFTDQRIANPDAHWSLVQRDLKYRMVSRQVSGPSGGLPHS